MNDIKISIIVPVYNVEKLISRCIDSILNQNFEDFELLLIDDGSKDDSGSICNWYAAKDSRIRVFHKENGGVSSARQMGKEMATGNFAIHVDPDDWIESDMLKSLYEEAMLSNSDIVICDIAEERGEDITINNQKPIELNCASFLDGLLTNLHGSCCNKLISKRMYKNASFPNDVNITEDLIYIFNILVLKPKISYVNKPLYHYIINDDAKTQSKTFSCSTFYQLNNALKIAIEIFNEKSIKQKVETKYLKSIVFYGLKSEDLSAKNFRKALCPYFFKYLCVKTTFKLKVAFILSFLGLKNLTMAIRNFLKD